ncbi:hypothetical protein CC85DRAFT_160141 [Cutaneotrichosporon oleaginosum]|uniref:Uncharacterized protein n=1 Tax=Cutaneotrichosporon oleaginosum TaxID=879819 RepID=A0A0J1AY69_9TREE|nr:uncharacterized protein CC85DRAFT_160141 [Cutaneotrichosporon oleaginosum]KLT40274.1 hypothetical protein CC85DRAFT_160141 [Cutaneotrichosporon oleaginosum]
MTHRSRSGGPPKRRTQTKKRGPKLNHPPGDDDRDEEAREHEGGEGEGKGDDDDDAGIPPASHFAQPTNDDVLTVLRWALLDTLNSDEFPALVQRAKGLLFERKWLELFTDPELLDAYAGRWVPSRALCFRDMMAGLPEVRKVFTIEGRTGKDRSAARRRGDASQSDGDALEAVTEIDKTDETDEQGGEIQSEGKEEDQREVEGTIRDDLGGPDRTHILSLGGGAGSELLAVAALASRGGRIRWTGVDVGAWGDVISRIETAARDRWRFDADFAFIEGNLLAPPAPSHATGPTPDVSPTTDTFAASSKAAVSDSLPTPPITPHPTHAAPAFVAIPALAAVPAPDITTLFFTLTELLSQNRARTVALLRAVTAATPRGGLLLVADSASDIAEFPLGKDGRTWPVYMVLDAIIGAISKAGDEGGWRKIHSEDSRWFRLSGERWPCKLENARYWMRVYRRV